MIVKSVLAGLLFSAASYGQATLAQWNFNGTSDTTVPGGALAPLPSSGSGSAMLVGGVTSIMNTGNTSTGATDPETTTPPNYSWQTTGYPAPGSGNKTAGVQFNVSTVGYADISFNFEQRLSNKAANNYVVQYTTDRTASSPVWIDAQSFTVTPAPTGTGDTWYNGRTVDLSGVSALDNNANVAIRIVAAFDPTAGDYLAARSTSTYDGTGTVRFDMVNVLAATTLGVAHFEGNRPFALSPNPARTNQLIQLSDMQDITVYDVNGKLVKSAKAVQSLDASEFTPGVYFVKTATGLTKKLVIQ